MRERTHLDAALNAYNEITQEFEDSLELIELAEAEGDDGVQAEAEAALTALQERVEKRRIESLLSGEADHNDAYLEIHAGAGGTESQDWAEMLLRMYVSGPNAGDSSGRSSTISRGMRRDSKASRSPWPGPPCRSPTSVSAWSG